MDGLRPSSNLALLTRYPDSRMSRLFTGTEPSILDSLSNTVSLNGMERFSTVS